MSITKTQVFQRITDRETLSELLEIVSQYEYPFSYCSNSLNQYFDSFNATLNNIELTKKAKKIWRWVDNTKRLEALYEIFFKDEKDHYQWTKYCGNQKDYHKSNNLFKCFSVEAKKQLNSKSPGCLNNTAHLGDFDKNGVWFPNHCTKNYFENYKKRPTLTNPNLFLDKTKTQKFSDWLSTECESLFLSTAKLNAESVDRFHVHSKEPDLTIATSGYAMSGKYNVFYYMFINDVPFCVSYKLDYHQWEQEEDRIQLDSFSSHTLFELLNTFDLDIQSLLKRFNTDHIENINKGLIETVAHIKMLVPALDTIEKIKICYNLYKKNKPRISAFLGSRVKFPENTHAEGFIPEDNENGGRLSRYCPCLATALDPCLIDHLTFRRLKDPRIESCAGIYNDLFVFHQDCHADGGLLLIKKLWTFDENQNYVTTLSRKYLKKPARLYKPAEIEENIKLFFGDNPLTSELLEELSNCKFP